MQHISQLGPDCNKHPSPAAAVVNCAAAGLGFYKSLYFQTPQFDAKIQILQMRKYRLSGLPEQPAECILQRSVTSKSRSIATSKILWRRSPDVV